MDTQTNRTLTAALTLALALGLTACGTSEDTGSGVDVEPPSVAATSPDATAPATTDDSTDDDADDTVDADDKDGAHDDADDTATGATGTADAGSGGDLTAVAFEAVGTAEAEAGGTAYEIDDQDDDGSWEVVVAVGDRSVEVTVSADGLTVVGTDEDDDLDGEDRAGLDAATITLQDAIRTALTEVGGTLDDAELEEEDGTHSWTVSVDATDAGDDDVDVRVDVSTGEVVEVDA